MPSKSPKDFFRPLAGGPAAADGDPGPAEPRYPLLRPVQREDGGQGAPDGRHRRCAPRQPGGRRQGRQQGGRPRGLVRIAQETEGLGGGGTTQL
ncbi:MAG: hypothetical protein R2731_10330 [Nocardioides sp.]